MILLLFACLTAYPDFRLELSLSSHGRRSAIGLTAKPGIPLTAATLPPLHDDIAGPLPRHRLPAVLIGCSITSLGCHYCARGSDGETARPTAQMKPANSRAIAVTAMFLGFPFLISAR